MPNAIPTTTERMPATVKTARFIMTLEIAFELAGLGFLVLLCFSTFDGALFLMLVYSAAMTGLGALFLTRWPSRRRRLLWAIVAYQVWMISVRLAVLIADSDLTWGTAVNLNALFALAVVVALLRPPGRRWFHA